MISRITVGAAVLNQTPLDWEGNLSRAKAAIADAKAAGAQLIVLPELALTGYNCEDMFHAAWVLERAWQSLEDLKAETAGVIATIGLPVFHHGAIYNAAALLVNGEIVGLACKRHLAGDGIYYEPRWFTPWPEGGVATYGEAGIPIGDLYFDVGGLRIGFEICEDAWTATRPGTSLALEAVDFILNPSASNFAFGKDDIRRRLVVEGSRSFGCSYVYANLLGNEAGRIIFDGGVLIASGGELRAEGPRFQYVDHSVTTASVDVADLRLKRAKLASYQPDHTDDEPRCVKVPFHVRPEPPVKTEVPARAAWELGEHTKEEEFSRAVALALFDYMRRAWSKGYIVSLSGGADSTAVASLVYLSIAFAEKELGLDGVKKRLHYIESIQGAASVKDVVRKILTTLYQGTVNSSDTTRNAARDVAAALGADHHVIEVDEMVRDYIKNVEKVEGRELTWERDDITLQNIQARVRGPSVWMLANTRNAILLATSNRSEAAVGYATMDGDTCGGLSPIAGIDKAYLREWLRWMEAQGPDGLEPIPALSCVNVQAPKAELRPQDSKQTDEGDLMPYTVLDRIERLAIRDKKAPKTILEHLVLEEEQYSREQLVHWVKRFFKLWCRNQWKRERYAPSFHLDDENLDPKTWCRFPILSSGFKEELAALDEL